MADERTGSPSHAGPRAALVTGAAGGIGAVIVQRLRAAGLRVAGLDLRDSDSDLSLVVDITDPDAVMAAAGEAEERLGPIEAAVTVAGHYERILFEEIDDARWRRMLDVHLGGTTNTVAAVLGPMRERGRGRIVTIASELALAGGDEDAHYAAAKGAIIGFTRSLAAEVAPDGVLVNCVAPGPTATPMLEVDPRWSDPDFLAGFPLRRIVTPTEVAETVGFLVEDGGYYSGQVLSPNAGTVI